MRERVSGEAPPARGPESFSTRSLRRPFKTAAGLLVHIAVEVVTSFNNELKSKSLCSEPPRFLDERFLEVCGQASMRSRRASRCPFHAARWAGVVAVLRNRNHLVSFPPLLCNMLGSGPSFFTAARSAPACAQGAQGRQRGDVWQRTLHCMHCSNSTCADTASQLCVYLRLTCLHRAESRNKTCSTLYPTRSVVLQKG